MAKMTAAEKAALDLQQQSLDLQKLDTEFKDRQLAAQIAIANAQQALNEKTLAEYQMGTLNEAKRAALVQEALQQAEQQFTQMMAMRNYGLDVGKLTGSYMGQPTEERRQFDVNTVMNAPRGPADFPAYINRLRGLNNAGMLPGVLQDLFNNQPIATMSNGGQQTPMPASNTDLALAMVGATGNQQAPTQTGQTAGTPQQQTNPYANLPPTNFLLPFGAAQPNPNYNQPVNPHDLSQGVDLNRYLYQEYMVDPNRPELGYNQPLWAGIPAPYTPPPTNAPPGTPGVPNVGPPIAPTFGDLGPQPTAPTFGPAPTPPGQSGSTPPSDPWASLPQSDQGHWVSSGYNGPGEYALANWVPNNQGNYPSGHYEPITTEAGTDWEWVPDDRKSYRNAPPAPSFAAPTWDAQKALMPNQSQQPDPMAAYQQQLAAYNASNDAATQQYQQQLAAWQAQQASQQAQQAAYQQALAAWNAAHPQTDLRTSVANMGQQSQQLTPSGYTTDTAGTFGTNGYQDPTRATSSSTTSSSGATSGTSSQADGGVFSSPDYNDINSPYLTSNVAQTPETLASQQNFGGNNRASLEAVQRMFSNVFNGTTPNIDPTNVSLQNFRKLSPTEQGYATGLVEEYGGMPADDFNWMLRQAAPSFSDSAKAYFPGLR